MCPSPVQTLRSVSLPHPCIVTRRDVAREFSVVYRSIEIQVERFPGLDGGALTSITEFRSACGFEEDLPYFLSLQMMPGRSAVWLARLNGVQEVGGSNPLAPIFSAGGRISAVGEGRDQDGTNGVRLLLRVLSSPAAFSCWREAALSAG